VVWPQNHSDGFRRFGLKIGGAVSSGLASKPIVTVSDGLSSKPAATVFSGLASKPVALVFFSLASKLVVTVSPGLTSKPVVGFLVEPQPMWWRVSRFWPQNRQLRFSDLGLTTTVSWFGPQNHAGFGLSVASQNRRREVGKGHVSRSSGLLHVKASLARVFQSGLKTGRVATAGGARGTIAKVASEAS
jgi:hypothetical protein